MPRRDRSMAKKKKAAKKSSARKKPANRKKGVRSKKKPSRPQPKKGARRKRTIATEISSGSERSSLGSGLYRPAARPAKRGLGEAAAGQSGSLQGISELEDTNSESVEELLEEGQAFEADVISGVENAPDAD